MALDIIGFVFVLLLIGIAPFFGVNMLVGQLINNLEQMTSSAWRHAKLWYVSFMAGKIIVGLIIAIGVQLASFILACVIAHEFLWVPAIVTAIFVAVEGGLALSQRAARPQYVMQQNGQPERYPRFLLDGSGHAVDFNDEPIQVDGFFITLNARGNPIRHQMTEEQRTAWINQRAQTIIAADHVTPEQATVLATNAFEAAQKTDVDTEQLVPHPLVGKRRLDESLFHPEELHSGTSFIVVVLAFLLNASALLYAGSSLENRALILLAMTNLMFAYAPIKSACSLAGWAAEKGIAFLEFMANFGLRQILPAFAGITYQNVREYVNLDIADERGIRNAIRKAPDLLFGNLLITMCWVFVIPHTAMLAFVAPMLIVAWMANKPLAMNDGALIVKERTYRFTYINSIVVVLCAAVALAWELTPTDGYVGTVKEYLQGGLHWSTLFGTGNLAASSGASGWSAFWLLVLGFGAAGLLAWIATKANGFSKILGSIVAVAAIIMGGVGFVGIVRLISHTQGQPGVLLPSFGPYASASAESFTRPAPTTASIVPTVEPEPTPEPTATVVRRATRRPPQTDTLKAPERKQLAKGEENRPEGITSCSPAFQHLMKQLGKPSNCAQELAKAP